MITGNWRNWTKPELLKQCFVYGRILDYYLKETDDGTGKPIEGPRLLWAIAGNESSFGANCKPRHELAYDWGGHYAKEHHQADLLQLYGSDAACSWGPWQVMPCNALGFKPTELGMELEKAATATVGYLKRFVLAGRQARTLKEVLDCYNSGTYRDAITPAVETYIERGLVHYFEEVISEADPAAGAAAGAAS
jgi:hypothetical protein